MTATENEIKRYHLSENDAKHFTELIDIKPTDYEVIYDESSVCVKFPNMSSQRVELIMKVALDGLKDRVNRQKEWDRLKNIKVCEKHHRQMDDNGCRDCSHSTRYF